MTPDLTWLAWTGALTAVLWMPFIIGQVMTVGGPTPDMYRDPTPPDVPAWVKRCNRAHQNALETLAPFAVVVLVAHVAGIANEMTAMWAMIFFFARVAHAVVYWLGIPFARTLVFAVGLVATLGIFYEIVTAAPAA